MAKVKTNAAKISKGNQKNGKAAKGQKAATASNGSQNASQTNPYRVGGGYWASVEALRGLGVGKLHPFNAIVKAVRKAMGASWKEFASKKGKMTADERALCNVMVLSRSKSESADYAGPLRKLGFIVEWDGRKQVAGIIKK